ncbi:MAG: hypothetical protein ACKV19_08500 [Verrucomicrobiales bacterium]
MKTKPIILTVVTTAVIAASSLSASAAIATFDFYKLKSGGQAGDFIPDGVLGTDYFNVSGDFVSSAFPGSVGGDLNYTNNGISLTATAEFSDGITVVDASVVQDHENAWNTATRKGAGLGVYKPARILDTSDDNITRGESLIITFDREVDLKNIGLRAEGHDDSWDFEPASFKLNGVVMLLPEGIGSIDVAMTGTEFIFEFGGDDRVDPDQFYLASLTACESDRVPEGGAALALFSLGLIGLGAFRKRLTK